MKLYTEEQVREAISIADSNDSANPDMILAKLKSIELPSDEEIEGACNEELNGLLSTFGFRKGAKWVIGQIKQQQDGK